MAKAVLMPKAGISVENCVISMWHKQVGDHVKVGDVLFGYETDKAAFECESTAQGVLLDIFYGNGDEVPALDPVCAVGQPGEDIASLRPSWQTSGAAAAGSGSASPGGAGPGVAGGAAAAGSGAAGPGGVGPGGASTGGVGGAAAVGSGSASPGGAGPGGAGGAAANSPDAGYTLDTAHPQISGVADVQYAAAREAGGKVKASPRARALASRLGISIETAKPSGPHGRIISRDVEAMNIHVVAEQPAPAQAASSAEQPAPTRTAASADQPAPARAAAFDDENLPKIRRAIADAMTRSLKTAAQLTHHHSFDATQILALRATLKSGGPSLASASARASGIDGISLGDMVLFATARTLLEHPDMNAHLLEGGVLRRWRGVHLGVAVDTPRGLMVPTVFDADKMSLLELSLAVKELAAAARSGRISPDALRGGTFTVSNLGATGVEVFTPILNPPQVGILGVCGIATRARVRALPGVGGGGGASVGGGGASVGGGGASVVGGGSSWGGGGNDLEAYPAMGLSITYDHRAVDGAPASRFAQALCKRLEQFQLLLAL